MSQMYIRVKKDGFIFAYNEILAKNPDCEVVPEEIAYPERFAPPRAAQRLEGRRLPLDLTTADIPEPPPYTAPELAADASRKLPK